MTLPFSPIDAAIVALLGYSIWNGYRSGFIATAFGLATWIVSFAAAVVFQTPTAGLIQRLALPPATARPLAFIVVLVAVEALFSLAGFLAVKPIVRSVHRNHWAETTDRVLGVFPSAARSLFVVGIVLASIVVSPVPPDLKAAVESSRLSRALIERITAIQPQLAALSGQAADQLPLFVTKLGEDDTQKLDLPYGLQLAPDPAAERAMLELVNQERANVGLKPLQWDERLAVVGRAHSAEMFQLKYFSHQSPVNGSPFDWLKAAGVTYAKAGENLAYAQSVAVAHRGLMDSPGHRANILDTDFTRIGIGVVSAGPYGRMFTQMFLTP